MIATLFQLTPEQADRRKKLAVLVLLFFVAMC